MSVRLGVATRSLRISCTRAGMATNPTICLDRQWLLFVLPVAGSRPAPSVVGSRPLRRLCLVTLLLVQARIISRRLV